MVIDSLQIFIILIHNLSHTCPLVVSSDFIFSNIPFWAAWKEFVLLCVLYEKDGRVLAYFIGVYIDA